MKTGVLLLNFGEPEHATEAEVVPFLERIFSINAPLEGDVTPERARARSAQLARRRAPGLIAEYRAIGGSPLNAQARAQAVALRHVLQTRGHDVDTFVAMQFTEPDIPTALAEARERDVQQVVALPVYPLCGPSTTVAALAAVGEAVRNSGWPVAVQEISGWHTHPDYIALRAEGVRTTAAEHNLDLDGNALLVFSAHGTPLKYLEEGSRYDLYVRDCCAQVAAAAGTHRFLIGYQNHGNRPIEWTQPEIAEALRGISAPAIVVVPISFMHEQSETLAELDHELREHAESLGLRFYRVAVPHDSPRFTEVLADLVEERLSGGLLACRCRAGARCTAAFVA